MLGIGAAVFVACHHTQKDQVNNPNVDLNNDTVVITNDAQTQNSQADSSNIDSNADPTVLAAKANFPQLDPLIQQVNSNSEINFLGDLKLTSTGRIKLRKDSVDSENIENHSIRSRDLAKKLTIKNLDISDQLSVDGPFTVGNASSNYGLGDDGDAIISGSLEVGGTIYGNLAGSFSPSGDIDMSNHILTNIGNSGTDFTASGGLNLVGNLIAPNVAYSVGGTPDRITSSGGQNPSIDISSSYAGQSSITILGTIGSGIWNSTPIENAYISSSSDWNTAFSSRVSTWNYPLSFSGNTVSLNYNATNLKLTSNALNTIQDISTSSSPTLAGLIATGNITADKFIGDGSELTGLAPRAATKVVCASDTSDQDNCDYVADGTADDVDINSAISALPTGGGRVILKEGTYNLTATITMSAGSEIIGQGWSTIMDVSGISSGAAVSMGNNSVLANIKIQGDITPLTSADKQIIAGNHSKIQRIWINENDGGIETANKVDVHINDICATQIHDSNGWAAVIHSSGTANGIYVDGIYIDNSDRGFEVEEGAKNFYAKNGYLKTVKVTGSYSFVLDVHTHDGNGAVENVVYENFYLEDTDGITAEGAGSDISKNITFKNITMASSAVSTGRTLVSVASAEKVTIDGLYVTNPNVDTLSVGTNSVNVVFNNVDMVSNGRPDLSAYGKNVTLQNSRFKNTPDADYGLNITGTGGSHILLDNVHVYNCRGYGCLQTGGSITYLTIQNSLFELDTSDPGSYGITASGGAPLKIIGNKILNSPTTAAISISGNANSLVSDNYLTAAWDSVWIRTDSSNALIYQNELASTRKVINDQGTGGTKIYRNKGYVTENSGTATIASGDTSTTITHGLSLTPTASMFRITPTNSLGNATKWYLDSCGATNCTLHVDQDPGATTATFSWSVGTN